MRPIFRTIMAMSVIPFLAPVEVRFDWQKSRVWLQDYWWCRVYMCTVYIILVFWGSRWMRDKPAFYLRRPLTMWNTGLAVFSIIGFLTVFPPLANILMEKGFYSSVCKEWVYHRTDMAPVKLWSLLFFLSKTVEFGDTMFVILRKKPLSFLHWYHHVTVYLYGAWFFGERSAESGIALWFGTTNYFVHSIMYSYYTLKAAGFKIPRTVAQVITLLQLAQFVLGVLMTVTAYVQKSYGVDCDASYIFLNFGLAIYVSYFVLFLNFFIQRYRL